MTGSRLRVRVIDADHQEAALSVWLLPQYPTEGPRHSLRSVFFDECTLAEATYPTLFEGIDVVPSGIDLSRVEYERPIGAENAIAAALAQEADEAGGRSPYDVTLIDAAPSLGLVTVAALTAGDEALVPVKVGGLDMQAMASLSVAQLPAPYDVAETVTRALNDQEREHLAVCEQALHGFRKSVIVAGKALDVINRGRLYRETHPTFADYVDEVWDMKRAHAYRMIEGWQPAALVSPIGDTNEAQARELAPALKVYGPEVTVALYRGVKELRGDRKVTAADLAEARAVLPLHRSSLGRTRCTTSSPWRPPRDACLASPPLRSQCLHRPPKRRSPNLDHVGQGELSKGAEAIATMERALAQQRQIYDALGGGTLAAAMLYDPNRGERLRHELRQYANGTTYRMRELSAGDEDTTPGV